MGFANLHLHSFWSDGVTPAGKLIELASAVPDLELICLTDHDNLAGIEPFFRSWRSLKSKGVKVPDVAVGVELSLYDPEHDLTLHLLGYFPRLSPIAPDAELARVEQALGQVCRRLTQQRGEYDLDRRVAKAYAFNLDGLAKAFPDQDAAVKAFRNYSRRRLERVVVVEPKSGDLCMGQPPATYQDLIRAWQAILPQSNTERITLYTLRKDSSRTERLAKLLVDQDGLSCDQAMQLAKTRQGCLASGLGKPTFRPTPFEGLNLLEHAEAVTVLAHPAVDRHRFSFEEFDCMILEPMARSGLQGVEVYYPYDPAYRKEAWRHYEKKAGQLGLMISGGTDFHGDGRTGWSEAPLEMDLARRLLPHDL